LVPKAQAYREAGWNTRDYDDAASHACRLERRLGVKDRIAFLSRQAEDLIAEKRQRIESQLWAIHEADIGAFWETYEAAKIGNDSKSATDEAGRMVKVRRQRPKLINDLPIEARKLIEDVSVDRNGNIIPKLYSKAQANAELRKLHNFGRTEDRPENDVARLSDAELIQQLSDQAKQLGIEIKLDYSFAQQAPATAADSAPPVDVTPVDVTPVVETAAADVTADDAAAVDAARDLRVGLNPAVAGARPVRKVR
jgi:hypothetical protein